MSTKFFNNNIGNSLFDKFKGIADGIVDSTSKCNYVCKFR